jgi:hypothetical protein
MEHVERQASRSRVRESRLSRERRNCWLTCLEEQKSRPRTGRLAIRPLVALSLIWAAAVTSAAVPQQGGFCV